MWTAVLGGLAKAGGFVADLASAALKWIGIIFAYRLGKRKAQQEMLEDTVEKQDEQIEIAARRPRDRSDIIDRMRDNDL